jgi:phage terminase large subunit-like protein
LLRELSDCASGSPAEADERLDQVLAALSQDDLAAIAADWQLWARDDQLPPPVDDLAWRTWIILGGRGAGKTRAGAEWVRALALGHARAGPAHRPRRRDLPRCA